MATAASCGTLNAPKLGLPLKATVPDTKGELPARMFIAKGASAKMRQRFTTDVESITMIAILRPVTTGLAESRNMPEILVLGLHVPHDGAVPVEVIDHIAAQRPGGIIFVCVRDGGILTGETSETSGEQCALAVRRHVPVKPGHPQVTKVHAGAWRPSADVHLTVGGTTMAELWDSLCAQAIMGDTDGANLDVRIARRDRVARLEAELTKAKGAHARAKTTEQRNAAYAKMATIRAELTKLGA